MHMHINTFSITIIHIYKYFYVSIIIIRYVTIYDESKNTQTSVLHLLCEVLKRVHRPDWKESQAVWQSTLPSTEEWAGTSKHLPWQSMSSRLDM